MLQSRATSRLSLTVHACVVRSGEFHHKHEISNNCSHAVDYLAAEDSIVRTQCINDNKIGANRSVAVPIAHLELHLIGTKWLSDIPREAQEWFVIEINLWARCSSFL